MGISGWTILGKLKKRIPVPIPDSLFNFLTANSLAYRHLPKAVFDVLTTEFGQNPRVYALFNEFLRVDTFQRKFVVQLLGVARGKAGDSWEVRRLAALMTNTTVPMGYSTRVFMVEHVVSETQYVVFFSHRLRRMSASRSGRSASEHAASFST